MLKKINESPRYLFYILTIGMAFGFGLWRYLLNNYTVDIAHFQGHHIGTLQSIREIPGLLAVTALVFLLIFSEQVFLAICVIVMGGFIISMGLFDTPMSLYIITLGMSLGFHYSETMRQSLSYQLLDKNELTIVMGKAGSIGAIMSLVVLGIIELSGYIFTGNNGVMSVLFYRSLYTLGGGVTILVGLFILFAIKRYKISHVQDKKPKLYKKYWLFYCLNILSGARRQIFVVFAPFLLVATFNVHIDKMIGVYLVTQLLTMFLAPQIGKIIPIIGEKLSLIIEHSVLICIFIGYAYANQRWQGIALYIADNIFFAMSYANSSYFKKIANPQHMASTSALTFTLNHIMAVFLPIIFGFIWQFDRSMVFYAGAIFALGSLVLSFMIPRFPTLNKISIFSKIK